MRPAPVQRSAAVHHLEAPVKAPVPQTVMQRGAIRADSLELTTTDFAITPAERSAAARGDLEAFWRMRADRDPVARTGLALWGLPEDLRDLVDGTRPSKISYVPRLSFALRWAVRLVGGPTNTDTVGQMLEHWTWIGNQTRGRVAGALKKQGYAGTALRQRMHALGVAIAQAHIRAVDEDIAQGRGATGGALSPRQIADYHHAVFEQFAIGNNVYGGTPSRLLPDWFELWFLRDLYCLDCDSH